VSDSVLSAANQIVVVHGLAVTPEHRRTGIATNLLRDALEAARVSGCDAAAVRLGDPVPVDVTGLLELFGFAPAGAQGRWWRSSLTSGVERQVVSYGGSGKRVRWPWRRELPVRTALTSV